jgi:integrase
LSGALDYAVEKKALVDNPFKDVKMKKRRSVVHQVDRRAVANPDQVRRLLTAVAGVGRTGRKLVAFFALMYFAGLRPEEATNIRRHNLALPPRVWDDQAECWQITEWGQIAFSRTTPEISGAWTDSGQRDEERGLKHREDDAERTVPMGPELALILYVHLDDFPTDAQGRLFIAERGGRIPSSIYSRTWRLARERVFDAETAASPLAKRPYDLRHACVSMWLNAGVEAPRVAEWAGHSLHVLLRVYAKCIDGGEQTARERVQAALEGR